MPTSKSDVYSLGILLWQIRERDTPFKEIDNKEVLIYKVRWSSIYVYTSNKYFLGGKIWLATKYKWLHSR